MGNSLRHRLGDLASTFASRVLDAIRDSSLEELLAQSSASGRMASRPAANHGQYRGRLARRSAGDIAGVIEQVVALLRRHPGGLRAEQIRAELDLEAKELPRPLKEGLEAGRFNKSGEKRATTYFVKGPKAPGRGGAPRGRKGGPARRKRRPAKRSKAPIKQAPKPAAEAARSQEPAA
jgi:hypothetical protein